MCTGRVTRLDTEKGWCYVACSKCSRKLQRTESAFTCVRYNNSHDVGVLCYRVELAIADDTAEGVSSALMVLKKVVNPEDSLIPSFITGMSFTITRILDDREHLPLPDFIDNGGGDNDGGDMGCDRTIPAKAESGGGSGEAALIAPTEPIGSVPTKLNDPTSQVVKKARMA
ncbi:hypothetical protein Bca4012_026655 [Brassica carinata]